MPDFPVPGMTCNPPGQGIDEYIGRSWEDGPALDMVVPDQPEYATLCEHCTVIADWTVAEVEDKTRGYAIAVNDLGHVSNGYECAPKSFSALAHSVLLDQNESRKQNALQTLTC